MEKSLPTLDKTVIKESIFDITFGEYVELAIGNFRILTSDPNVPDEKLQTVRQMIIAEFAETAGDYAYVATMQTSAKIMRLNLKLLGLTLSEQLLGIMYSPDTWSFLQEQGIISRTSPYPSKVADVEKAVAAIRSEISVTRMDIAELEALQEKTETDDDTLDGEHHKKYTEKRIRAGFTRLLASISQYVKFGVTYETNCAVVAEYVNRLRKYQESLETNKK